jgi:hypothetical protein
MKKRTKFAILLLAIFLTFGGFNLISSSDTVHMIKLGKEAGYHIISNHLAMHAKDMNLDR